MLGAAGAAAAGFDTAGATVVAASRVAEGANLDFFLRGGGFGGGLVVSVVDTDASSLRPLFLVDMLILILALLSRVMETKRQERKLAWQNISRSVAVQFSQVWCGVKKGVTSLN